MHQPLKFIYVFGSKESPLDGQPTRELAGGKGFGLLEMSKLGLPVPPGFTITSEACNYYRLHNKLPDGLIGNVKKALKYVEAQMGSAFGDSQNPLLLSVRSGARVSMPGMMETVLDLGLNNTIVKGLATSLGCEWAAADSYRRFIQMYSNIVAEVDAKLFEDAIEDARRIEGVELDSDLSVTALKDLCETFRRKYFEAIGDEFPDDPWRQLEQAIMAVFRSWDSSKASAYRSYYGYPDDWGTAVTVMAMVYGNRGNDSGTGVGFTRNPITGEKCFYGEYLLNAQGEDVVGGIRTPAPINRRQKELGNITLPSLDEIMPHVYEDLLRVAEILEKHFHDMQDIEFTIDKGRLFMLQTRVGKRTGIAAVKIAIDMLEEGKISEKDVIKQVDASQLSQLLAPVFDEKEKKAAAHRMTCRGLNAAPGAAHGMIALTSERASAYAAIQKDCILVREETSPEDFAGMVASKGVLTMRGGATSHAAVVARGLGLPCVCGCSGLIVDNENKRIKLGETYFNEGEEISIDGSTGEVYSGSLKTSPSELIRILVEGTMGAKDSELHEKFQKLMDICDGHRRMKILVNADTPQDARVARAFGAEGIGLTRTEHMFMDKKRLMDVRCVFFSEDEVQRKEAIDRLLPYQRKDLFAMFKIMKGCPVTIRLVDPPRHEFLPQNESEKELTAEMLKIPFDKYLKLERRLEERNPMLGFRGCRLGIMWPEVTKMQCRAIFHAAIDAFVEFDQTEGTVLPEIMIPLVMERKEFTHQKQLIDITAKEVFDERNVSIPYKVGTMIEVPRAAFIADELVKHGAQFFSFGSNDLTQCTFGLSRDDAWQFLPSYIEGIPKPLGNGKLQMLYADPFQSLDDVAVASLMRITIDKGRSTGTVKIGICGEHGGDPKSILICEDMKLDYISCSPYRIPIARCAAAKAFLASAS